MEIVPGVHRVDGLIPWPLSGGVFLLVGERLVLVDTGLRGSGRAIERYVRQIGRSMDELDTVVLTHHHMDHAGAVAELRRDHPFQVAAHEAEVPFVEGALPDQTIALGGLVGATLGLLRPAIKVRHVPVDRVLRDGAVLPMLGGVQVVHVPGHTPGSICLYLPAHRLALVGDTLCVKPWGPALPSRIATVNMAQARRSIARLLRLDLELVCPSHGPPCRPDRIRNWLA